jgi:hypothetical protein
MKRVLNIIGIALLDLVAVAFVCSVIFLFLGRVFNGGI